VSYTDINVSVGGSSGILLNLSIFFHIYCSGSRCGRAGCTHTRAHTHTHTHTLTPHTHTHTHTHTHMSTCCLPPSLSPLPPSLPSRPPSHPPKTESSDKRLNGLFSLLQTNQTNQTQKEQTDQKSRVIVYQKKE